MTAWRSFHGWVPVALAVWAHAIAAPARGQSPADPLARPLSIHLLNATIDDALRGVATNGGVRLSYSSDLLPSATRITLDRERTTVGDALREILTGTGLGLVAAASDHVIVLRAPVAAAVVTSATPSTDSLPSRQRTTPQLLDRILVMGSPAAGAAERDLAPSVSVVTADQIRASRVGDLSQLFRDMIPGVVAWDLGVSGPVAHIGSIRGSSSFHANAIKSYLDGVELANPALLMAIEPELIDRLELIRGPQGSALHGSDAISGVAHVVTSKGAINSGRPRASGTISGGWIETDFAGSSPLLQRHTLAVRGGRARSSYNLQGTFAQHGGWVTSAEAGSRSALATGRLLRGSVMAEGTARITNVVFTVPANPFLVRMLGGRTAPRLADSQPPQLIAARTFGVKLLHEPSVTWRQSLVVGYDHNGGALPPQRNAASVADALLGASEETAGRFSVRYSAATTRRWSDRFTSTATVGAEHARLQRERSGPRSVIDPGAPTTTSGRTVALFVDTIRSTGAFAQVRAGIGGGLALTAGLRGERSSTFGDGFGTAWSPMAGLAITRRGESFAAKWRAAYGRGIRPPAPSARRSLGATGEFRQIANPDLAPEVQSGVEGGVDLFAGERWSLSLTGYDQLADGLIQHVLPDQRVGARIPVVMQQNVGQITNRGIEAQGVAALGPMTVEGWIAGVQSRVKRVSKTYTGELRPGDRVPEVPGRTGALSVTTRLGRGRVAIGASHIGEWVGYDWLRYYKDLIDDGAAGGLREYWIEYPASLRVHASLNQSIVAGFDLFVRADNLTNDQRDGRDNMQILAGRSVRVGISRN